MIVQGITMPTDAPAKPKQETWRDWMPEGAKEPEELLTREEIAARLADLGIVVKPRELIYWHTAGVLPYPVKRRHAGATRALYPDWYVPLIRELLTLKREGYKLPEIAGRLRTHARLMLAYDNPAPLTPVDREAWTNRSQDLGSQIQDLGPKILAVARSHEHITGTRIAAVEIRFIDDRGFPLTYTFPA